MSDELPEHARPSVTRAFKVSTIWLLLWLVPVGVLLVALGKTNVFSQIAIFFSKMAMVTFGGAYAVLAYVAQQAVDHYHWVGPREMLDGLGMAETTPGPLIMVLQFVGFMAAFYWGKSQRDLPWRNQWQGLGSFLLFGLTPLFFWLVRSAPDGSREESEEKSGELPSEQLDYSVNEALATPAFWLFGIATSLYGLVSAGVSLFNDSLLIERGFEKSAWYDLGMMTTAIGLV